MKLYADYSCFKALPWDLQLEKISNPLQIGYNLFFYSFLWSSYESGRKRGVCSDFPMGIETINHISNSLTWVCFCSLYYSFLPNTHMDGWMDAHFGPWVLPLSMDYSLASYPSTEPLLAAFRAEWFQQISHTTVANTQPEWTLQYWVVGDAITIAS